MNGGIMAIRRLLAAVFGGLAVGVAPSLAIAKPLDRIMEYEAAGLRRQVRVDGRTLVVMTHPTEPALLVQRNAGAALMQGAAEGLSLGAVPAALSEDVYRRAAQEVLRPLGCRVLEMRPLDGRVSWEAFYACPAGVSPRR